MVTNPEENVVSNQVKTEGQQQDAQEDIKTQLEQTKLRLAETEERANKVEAENKSHRSTLSTMAKRVDEATRTQSEIAEIKRTVGVLTKMMAADLDTREPLEEELPKRRRSEEFLAELKPEVKPPQPQPPEEWIEADKIAKEVGLNILESDELAKAYRLFIRGNYEDGLTEVKKVADDIRKTKETLANQPKKKTVDELTETEIAEIAGKWMEKKGLLVSDVGKSAGSVSSETKLRQDFIAGKILGTQYAEECRKRGIQP